MTASRDERAGSLRVFKIISLIAALFTTPTMTQPSPTEAVDCQPGGCCTFTTATGLSCLPAAGEASCSVGAYKSCDPGACAGDGLCEVPWGGTYSGSCCS